MDPLAHRVGVPISLFQGVLELGESRLPCHVLSDGRRVIAQRELTGVLTGGRKGGLTRYLETNRVSQYIDAGEVNSRAVRFSIPGENFEALGYEAVLLIEICDAYLRAREDRKLTRAQQHIAQQAEIIVRTTAKLGIEALVDEVTGYQAVREKNALQLKIQAFIAEEMQEWARMFPEEFWMELARLEHVHYSARQRPIRWGRYVMAFVYDAVDGDIGQELRRINPNPHYKQNHHQWLKNYGREKVRDHLNQVLGVMKLCRDMPDFNAKFAHVFKKSPLQMTFFDLVDVANRRN